MSVKELRWLFVVVLAVAVFIGNMSEPATFGISQQWTNGNYSFAGGTHPVALTLALIIAVLYLLLMFAPPAYLGEPLPGVVRRFFTFWLDFMLAMILIAPIMGFCQPSLSGNGREFSNGTSSGHYMRRGWMADCGRLNPPRHGNGFLFRISFDSSQTFTGRMYYWVPDRS